MRAIAYTFIASIAAVTLAAFLASNHMDIVFLLFVGDIAGLSVAFTLAAALGE